MHVRLMSDLHIEQRGGGPVMDLDVNQPAVLILAGDIHRGDCVLKWIVQHFLEPWPKLHVIYVEGNHEYYGDYLNQLPERLSRDARLSCMQRLHYLNQSQLVLHGIRFLGTTLWSDFRLNEDNPVWAMHTAENYIADYRSIRLHPNQPRLIVAQDLFEENNKQVAWLEHALDQPFKGKTVVVTHHAPSIQSIDPRFKGDGLSPVFASNFEHLAQRADYWFHGHTHYSVDYFLGKCRVLSNPRGYQLGGGSFENDQFNPDLMIEI